MKNNTLRMTKGMRIALLVLLLNVVGMTKMYAYDFSAVCETGQTLYYNITDATNHYVELTCPGEADYNNCWTGFTKPTGNIILPESVQYNGITYSVTSLGSFAFYYCSGLTGSLTIPNSVTAIGYDAFYGCSGFTGSLTIPNTVTSIGYEAFIDCSGFTGSLTIPNSVTTIGNGAFYGCSGFTGSLTIPNTLTTIGMGAFGDCTGFTEVHYNATNCEYVPFSSSPFFGCGGTLIIGNNVERIPAYMFSNGGFTGSLTIPNSVTTIGYYAFSDCTGFTSNLTIGNSVTTISEGAFSDCTGFTGNLTISSSVTEIDWSAFINCSGFEQIIVDSGNEVYDSRENCNALIETATNTLYKGCKNTIIPNSVTSIGNFAFYNCSGFTGNLTISNSVTTIGPYAFYGCSSFTGNLTIPNSVTTIYDYAFCGCTGFTGSLTIPNSVTTISEGAFGLCSGFTGSLTIPNFVTTIGNYAFYGCSGFTSMSILAETPPSVGTDAFYNVNPDIPVTVPCGCIPVYEASDWHNYFTTILEDCTVISENDENTITIYPNPTNGQLKIEAEGLKHITINNMLGQVIYESKASGNMFEYDFSRHGEGLYLVRIETVSGVVVKKVSVTR